MSSKRNIAVIDIGKTNAKLALVDLETLDEIAVVTRPNKVHTDPPWPHFDLDGHWAFLLDALANFYQSHGIDSISITTHGASITLLDREGNLAAPMLDYEHAGPDEMADDYNVLRPDFSESGSPRLPMGLNVGAQLHWMFNTDPDLKERTEAIVTYPQYWGFRLTGKVACDVSSLGCHTDLWRPYWKDYSSLVDQLGIRSKMAPARPANEILGAILPEIAAKTGLPTETQVYVGIHDSNASLLPHLLASKPPFSVISTGTWVIIMAVGGREVTLQPEKDTLVNVNAFGSPVPSARFMGGREFERAMQGEITPPSDADIANVLSEGLMLLPALQNDSGPFMGKQAHWLPEEQPIGSGLRTAVVSFYLAMVSAHCLDMVGHEGPIIVEGPFTRNTAYLDMLGAATNSPVVTSGSATGTSQGAALLTTVGEQELGENQPRPIKEAFMPYAARWRDALASHIGD